MNSRIKQVILTFVPRFVVQVEFVTAGRALATFLWAFSNNVPTYTNIQFWCAMLAEYHEVCHVIVWIGSCKDIFTCYPGLIWAVARLVRNAIWNCRDSPRQVYLQVILMQHAVRKLWVSWMNYCFCKRVPSACACFYSNHLASTLQQREPYLP